MAYDNLRKGRVSIPHQVYFLTTVTTGRVPYFTDLFIGRLVVNEMRILHDTNAVNSFAWVLMPDHLHWLFELGEEYDLGNVVKRENKIIECYATYNSEVKLIGSSYRRHRL